MIALRQLLNTYLDTKHTPSQVFYDDAPPDTPVPYIIFGFGPGTQIDESVENVILEINGWDIPPNNSTIVLETLMESIDGDGDLTDPTGLNQLTLRSDDISIQIRRDTRLTVPDEDKTIKHKLYTYIVSVYEEETII